MRRGCTELPLSSDGTGAASVALEGSGDGATGGATVAQADSIKANIDANKMPKGLFFIHIFRKLIQEQDATAAQQTWVDRMH